MVAALSLALTGCGETTVVTGAVHDNFGDPVAGVDILVDGSQTTSTDAEGGFEFSHPPGQRVALRVEGDGYAVGDFTLAVGRGGAPVALVVQRMPPAPGLWVLGAEGYQAIRTCTQTARPYGSANMRYFVDEGIPTEVFPSPQGIVAFVDTGIVDGEPDTRMARVGNDHLFYRTEARTSNADAVFTENVATSEVTPTFKSTGRWFNARLNEGTYVQYDRLAVPPFNNFVPDGEGRCYLFRVGPPTAQWLDDAITDEQLAAFREQVRACFQPPGDDNVPDQVVSVRVALNPDGSVAQSLGARGPLDTVRLGTSFLHVQSAAAAAVSACGPYQMFPADAYAVWSEMTITLKGQELLAP